MNIFTLSVITCLMSLGGSQMNIFNDYQFKTSKDCLILVKQGISLDTLCLSQNPNSFKANKVLNVTQGKITKIDFIVGGTDFGNLYYLLEEWIIKDDRLVCLSSLNNSPY